jgi:hypothetical protein
MHPSRLAALNGVVKIYIPCVLRNNSSENCTVLEILTLLNERHANANDLSN